MIAMGREPEALHACLEATDRRSLREIHRLEFGKFTSAGKPPTRRKEKLNLARPSPKFEKAIEVYDKLKAEGTYPGRQAVSKAAGVSEHVAQLAIAARRTAPELKQLLARGPQSTRVAVFR